MEFPSVSCVVPCHNAAGTLRRAVRSVLAQDHVRDCVLVDDASGDDTRAVANRLAAEDARVRVIGLARNLGQAAARNVGAALAGGDLLVFLDADDEYLPGFFAAAVRRFAADPAVAAIKVGVEIVGMPAHLSLPDDDPRYAAVVNSSASNMMLWKFVFFAAGGFPLGPAFGGELGGEDIALVNAVWANYGMYYLGQRFLRVHDRPGSHLARYLARTRVENGRIVFTADPREVRDGAWQAAVARHRSCAAAARQRIARLLLPAPR